MLPGMDGFEICSLIREKKNTPIIIVSAKKDDIDKIRGLGIGADDYMTKPFSPSELVARVKAHLSRYKRLTAAGTKENEIIEIRGLKIDRTARRVYINGEEKTLLLKSLICWHSLHKTLTTFILKKNFLKKYGNWNPLGILQLLLYILKKYVRKSRSQRLNHNILKQYGGLDTGLKCKNTGFWKAAVNYFTPCGTLPLNEKRSSA